MGKNFRPSVRRLLVVVALVLTTILGLPSVPLASAAVTGTLEFASPDPAIRGEVVTLRGAFEPLARPAQLMRRVDGGSWTVVSNGQVGSDGKVRFRTTAPRATTLGYRVVAPQVTLGRTTHAKTQTSDVSLEVAKQVGRLDAPARVHSGTPFSMRAAYFPARPGREVVLQKRSGTRWTTIATQTADEHGGATFVRNAGTTTGTFEFRALAMARNGAAKVATDRRSVNVVVSGDIDPPPVPGDVSVVLRNALVHVNWRDVSATDLRGYYIYRAETYHGPWVRQNPTHLQADIGYLGSAEGRDDYWYAVTSMDDARNESARSTPMRPALGHLSPTGLVATPGDGRIELTWSQVDDSSVAGYRVQRFVPESGWTPLTNDLLTGATYADESAENDTTYTYRVIAVTDTGRESAPSGYANATPADTTPPGVPTGLTATGGDGQVDLVWNAVTAPDLTGYHIERSIVGTETWTPLTPELVTGTGYTDESADNNSTYSYRVRAVDNAGNPSEPSATANATTRDTIAPGAPTGLVAVRGDGRVDLGWDAVDAADLAGYHIERTTTGGTWTRVPGTPLAQTSYTDTAVTNDTAYSYRVVARDGSGNESQPSETASATPTDLTPPAVPTGVQARAWNSVVAVRWNGVPDSDLAGYDVLMATDPAGPWQVTNAARVTGTSYVVTELTNATSYHFRVVAVDRHGNRSERSVSVTAMPAPKVTTLDAGQGHTCRIRSGQSLACWGSNGTGQLGDGTQIDRAVSTAVSAAWRTVSAGGSHTCGVRTDASLWCWGHNFYGQVGDGSAAWNRVVPTQVGTDSWRMTDLGGSSSCAVRADGTLWCWGSNGNGQLGDGTTTNRLIPTQVGNDADWRDVSVGGSHTCGIRTAGTIWCWGYNFNGELGDGTTINRVSPTQVGTTTSWTSLSAGANQTCATRKDGTAWCWGANNQGQLGDGTRVGRTAPTQIGTGTNWTTVSTGNGYTCGLRGFGERWCWGANWDGQLGDGTASPGAFNPLVPVRIGNDTWNEISAGGNAHTCGVKADDSAWCWGRPRGALGAGHLSYEVAPHQVPGSVRTWTKLESGALGTCGIALAGSVWCSGLSASFTNTEFKQFGTASDWTDVTTGANHTCGLRGAGSLWCAGQNDRGQLGTSGSSSALRQVGTETDWTDVAASGYRTCGLRSNNTAWCWGDNFSGQVGDGTSGNTRGVPTQAGTATDWETLAVGSAHTCGLRAPGSLWCWGGNRDGQLGDGTTTDRPSPVQIGTATTWTSVTAHHDHTCATRTDGTLWCWGYNGNGQLGDGTTTARFSPKQVGTDANWAAVSAGSSRTCGIRSSGALWCWGAGLLGDGTTSSRSVPTNIGTASWASVSVGNSHICGTRPDGTGWCWGDNSNNQLGFFNGSMVPVAVIE